MPPAPRRSWPWAITIGLLAVAGALIAWWKLSATQGTPVPAAGSELVPVGTAPAQPRIPEYSVEQLLQEPSQGDWLVARLRGAPAILIIEFPDLREQGLALNRAAALLEKAGGRRDRVMTDAELGALLRRSGDTVSTFYFGHDYLGKDLARFYTLAKAQGLGLNTREQRLNRLLLDAGMLREDGSGGYQAVDTGVLVSFSAVQGTSPSDPEAHIDAVRRSSILQHELSHGRYYTDAAYRRHCEFFWRELLTDAERDTWRRYLGSQDYDTGNEDLMINETQALLMHTADRRDFSAENLDWKDADLEGLRERFRLGWPG